VYGPAYQFRYENQPNTMTPGIKLQNTPNFKFRVETSIAVVAGRKILAMHAGYFNDSRPTVR